MSDRPASLDTLPQHLIEAIAAYTGDAKSVWRLLKVCTAVRLGAEPALKPYFEERKIIGSPPLTTDIFELIPKKFAERDSKRDLGISKRSQRFDDLLAAHPSAGTSLRRLTVEVDDYKRAVCFAHIQRFAPQLTALSVIMRDSFWEDSIANEGYDDAVRSVVLENSVDTPHVWDDVLAGIQFPHLTHLELISTSRGGEHAAHILSHVPHLKSLVISSHFWGEHATAQEEIFAEPLAEAAPFPNFEHLVLAGHGAPVEALAEGIIPHSPKLTTITLQISDATPNEYSDWRFHSCAPLLRSIAQCKQLKALALYGEAAYHFGASLLSLQKRGVPGASLENLKRLFLDEIQMDADRGSIHHLLDIIHMPELPAIEQIFWSHRQRSANTKGMRTNHSVGVAQLRNVFNQYPTLQKVHWLDAYASDISADPLEPVWSAAHIFCHAARPIDDQPIRPIYPIRVEAPPTVEQAAVAARAAAKVPTRKSERQRVSKGRK